ncbi:MAG: ABC transporter ATP-binding protein/permease [Kaiparowitsia implicata GSE-PSE-MK54-09C]|jgi:subfamily B ATP-binding cassette protein MsbA|nr:ABC transporter ATP-binding protein/permease [Kaiparowitsia implicata GSE-PSE-MK54-09C]
MPSQSLLLQTARQYPGWVVLTVVLGFSGAVFNGVSTAMIVPVLLNFLGQTPDSLTNVPVLARLFAPFEGIPDPWRLVAITLAIVVLIVLKNGSIFASMAVSAWLQRLMAIDLRESGLRLLLEVDLDYFTREGTGDIVNRMNAELNRAALAITIAVRSLTTAITILVFGVLLLVLSWQLTLVTGTMLGLVMLANQLSLVRAKQFGTQLSDASRDYTMRLLDVLNGMRLVRATASEEQEYITLRQLMRDREQADYQSFVSFSVIGPVSEVAGVIALIAVVIVGRLFLMQQVELASTVLLTYLLLIFRLLPLIAQLNGARNQYANAIASIDIATAFLRRNDKPLMANGSVLYTPLKTSIQFEQVFFTYPGQAEQVLRSISLEIPKGTTLALVGKSGAGKSTLGELLPRFYDPTEGRILLDGRDLREFEVRSLRRSMGIISQDTFLFNGTVRENVTYGCDTVGDGELLDVAKRAHAWEFIAELPRGWDTPLGDRGILLSGGQRQRLAIARVLLQNPDILILDEATSALDTVSERLVQEALDHLKCDRTTLIIAHRLSTIQRAEQIAVLDNGNLVELGTHEALLAAQGFYARLYQGMSL